MTVIGTKVVGARGERIVYVDADPTGTPVDAPAGSIIVEIGAPNKVYLKDDDGSSLNSTEIGGGGGGGALTFVSKTEITGAPASALDITGYDTTSKTWITDIFGEVTADGPVEVVAGLSAVFKATGYRFHTHTGQDNSATYIAQVATADNQFAITQNQAESTVTRPFKFTIRMYDPGLTDRRKFFEWRGVVLNNSARADAFRGGGVSDVDDTAFDTIRTRVPGTTLGIGTVGFLYKLAEA